MGSELSSDLSTMTQLIPSMVATFTLGWYRMRRSVPGVPTAVASRWAQSLGRNLRPSFVTPLMTILSSEVATIADHLLLPEFTLTVRVQVRFKEVGEFYLTRRAYIQ